MEKFTGKEDFDLELPEGGTLRYFANYLTEEAGDILFNELFSLDRVQSSYNYNGNSGLTPRLMLQMGQSNFSYLKTAIPWSLETKKLKKRIEREFEDTFEYAHLNLYRDGTDSISWHNDKETQAFDSVYSVSIGSPRKFQLRPIDATKINHQIMLQSNSLLILDYDAIKRCYKHHVPKEKAVTEPRINITFRIR